MLSETDALPTALRRQLSYCALVVYVVYSCNSAKSQISCFPHFIDEITKKRNVERSLEGFKN